MRLKTKEEVMNHKKQMILMAMLLAALVSISYAGSFGPHHDKVVSIFEGDDEPTAQFAVWSKPDTFKVGVIYDGSNRDDYARHVCNVLNDEGFRGRDVLVHVLDVVKLTQRNEWVVIGKARCK
jgi:hypothetical protein